MSAELPVGELQRLLLEADRVEIIPALALNASGAVHAATEALAAGSPAASGQTISIGRDNYAPITQIGQLILVQTPAGAALGAVPASPPVRVRRVELRPRRVEELIGRDSEMVQIRRAIAAGAPLEFWGEDGRGKTTLARAAAHLEAPEHGVVWCDGDVGVFQDLKTHLYAAFTGQTDRAPTDAELRAVLQGVVGLVVADDHQLSTDELRRLLDLAPSCAFIVFSQTTRLELAGQSDELGLLEHRHAMTLLESRLGRAIADSQLADIGGLVADSGASPLAVIAIADALLAGSSASALRSSGPEPAERGILRRVGRLLSRPDAQILAIVSAAGGGPLGADALERITGTDGPRRAEALAERGLLQRASPAYRLPTPLREALPSPEPGQVREVLAAIADASEQTPVRGILSALAQGRSAHQAESLGAALGRFEPLLFRADRIGAWGRAHEIGRDAALVTGDTSGEALHLHELGTLALATGHEDLAKQQLTHALEIREGLGEKGAANLTRHNLRFVHAGVPPTIRRDEPEGQRAGGGPGGPRWFLRPWFLALVAVLVALAVGLLIARGGGSGSPSTSEHLTTPTTATSPTSTPTTTQSAVPTLGLTLDPPEVTVGGGASALLTLNGATSPVSVTLSSSESKVAQLDETTLTLNDGQTTVSIRPVGPGEATITASASGITPASATLTVLAPVTSTPTSPPASTDTTPLIQ